MYVNLAIYVQLNELIYAGVKLVCDKNWCFPKEHEQKLKTYMGNSTEKTNKKSMTTSENDNT